MLITFRGLRHYSFSFFVIPFNQFKTIVMNQANVLFLS